MKTKDKILAVLTFMWFLVLMLIKKVWALFFYPIAYYCYDWVWQGSVRKAYTIPDKIKANPIKWFLWLHYDDNEVPQGSNLHQYENNCFKGLWCAYKWSAIRNPMYNVAYNYFSNMSLIVDYEKVYGNYDLDRKLRNKYGDNGVQFVWFRTAKGQTRFIFSMAIRVFNFPITTYWGWNPNTNGRITVGLKGK